jgi:hypothetical protein
MSINGECVAKHRPKHTLNKLFLVAAVAGAVTSITQVHTVCDFHQSNAALAIFIVKTVQFFVSLKVSFLQKLCHKLHLLCNYLAYHTVFRTV